jgi:hypothetical protein
MKLRFAVALAAALLVAVPQVAVAQHMDINTVINSIGGSKFLRDAGRADGASGLRVVRLSTLAGAEQNASRLWSAVELKARDVQYLRSNLVLNPWAMSAIRGAGFGVRDIVAIDMAGDGGGVIYANDL